MKHEGVMNDGVWEKMRNEEGGQKENGQEKIAKDMRRVQLPASFTPLEKAADRQWCTLAATIAN